MKRVIKANYGGAFDIDPEAFFTRDDVNDLADAVAAILEQNNLNVSIQSSYIENNGEAEVTITDADECEYTGTAKVDMRRIRKPSDLASKYSSLIANDIMNQMM